jgi:hypothetical protein
MTNNINVQIIEPPLNNLIIETQVGSEPINVSVVSYSGTNISIIHDLPVLPSNINDNIASLLVAGSGISLNYNSQVPSLIISSSGGATLSTEQVQDIVGSFISGVSYISVNYDDNNNILYISATGLQPSGNYALANHNHTSNHITDFNSSVSGLLPVKNISSGSGINVTNNSGNFVIAVTGTFGLTSEEVDDRVGNLLVGGSNIVLNYNDFANQLTISTSGLQPSGNYSVVGHTHSTNDITNFNSEVNSLVSGIYAPLNSPNFSGIPTVPTASSGTNSTQAASTAFVRNEISNLVNSAPSTLDTLNELASALGNDPNFATTIASGLANKAPLVHTHSSSDITDFAISVSGLLPVKNISAGSYINVSQSGTNFIVSATGLQPSGNYSIEGHTHDRLTNGDKEAVLDSNGSLTFPSGSILSETNNTLSIAPPTAASGQSLVIRPTVALWTINSSNYIEYGSPITISVTLNSWAYFGTVNYTISGAGVTPQSLGRALNGKLTFVSTSAPDTETITWTIPANSNISEFTLTLTSVDGTLSTDPQTQNDPELYYNFEYNGMPTGQFITVTNNGVSSSEHSHVHLVAGDPTTVDIYLGDDDQYVKIEKDGGDVIVGTDSNNNHWIFDTSGNLRTPTNSIISKGYPGLTQDGSSWFVAPSGSLGGLASTDGQQYIQIGDNSEIYIGLGWPNNAVEWIFNRNGSLTLPSGLIFVDNTIQTTAWSGAVSINDITDFASGVSGLLPTVSGSGYAVTSFNNNIYSISVTGLQPSGNYSLDGHNHIIADVSGLQTALDNKQPSGIYASGIHYHVSADISDFTSSVSGLLPVIANSGDNRILTSTGSTVGVNAESNLTFDGNLLSVSGNLVAVSGTYNQLIFNTSLPDPDLSQGQLQWNSSEGTLDLGFTDTYSQHMGEELHYRVRNNTTSTLTKGTAVYASGLTPGGNNRIEVAPFTADGSVREVRFMGLVTENISNGVNGYTTQFGYIRGIDTRGDAASNGYAGKLWDAGEPSWSEGDILYAHPIVAGKLTKVEPKHSISVAIILNRHQNQGKIFVRPTSYGHLDDNHDVSVSGATNGQFLQYNSSTDYWVPSSSGNFTTLNINGTGVSVNGHTHTSSDITDFNSSVSGLLPVTNIVGGTNISVVPSGSSFTVSVSGSLGLTTEEVDDRVSSLLVAGTGISLDYSDSSNTLTINTSGLQPSGNYSVTGHTHTSSQITDFNSSVSGLLPVTNLTSGSGISISSSSGNFTVNAIDNIINSSNLYLWSSFR